MSLLAVDLLTWFNLDTPHALWLAAFGLLGQAIFFARWVVQWLASESRGRSHVPELFWWCSLVGATMLFTYFLLDRDPVGLLGQSAGWMIYGRNLYLVRRERKKIVA